MNKIEKKDTEKEKDIQFILYICTYKALRKYPFDGRYIFSNLSKTFQLRNYSIRVSD